MVIRALHTRPPVLNTSNVPAERTADDGRLLSETFRVVAFPVDYAMTDEVIINDRSGRTYMLSSDASGPKPLEQEDVNALGMFFEPSQDSTWHTVSELRRMFYGGTLDGPSGF